MTRILLYECRRVLSKRLLLVILVLMIVSSTVSSLWGDSTYTTQRKQVYDSVAGLSTSEEKISALQEEYERLNALRSALFEELDAGENVDFSLDNSITGNVLDERTLYEGIVSEMENLARYDVYLDNVEQNAAQMSSLSLFVDTDSFESKVIAKTPEAYKHLRGTQIKIEFPDGAEGALQSVFPWIGLILAVVFACTLFSEEIEDGSARVIRATKNGRDKLLTVRLCVLLLSSFLIGFLLVGIPLVINLFRWGLGDLNRPIQSLPAFYTSPMNISVGGYYLMQAATLAVAVLLTELITVLFCNLLGGSVAVYAAMISTLTLEALGYYLISHHSFLNPLKYLNLIALGDSQNLFSDYRVLNLFGNPVSLHFALTLTILLVLALVVPVLYRLSFTREPVRLTLSKCLQREKKYHFSLLTKEAYRLFITQKVILILAVMVGLQWFSFVSYAPVYDQEDMRLRAHITAINGKLDESCLAYIADQEAYYSDLGKSLEWYNQRFADGEISPENYQAILQALQQQMQGQESFYTFKAEAEQLMADGKTIFLYKTGYELLLGITDGRTVAAQGILAMVFTALALASIYAADNASGFANLLYSTARGREYLFRRKLVLAVITTTLATLVAYLPYIANVLKFYGSFQLGESIQLLTGFPIDISILGFIILLMIWRVILSAVAGAAVTHVSRKSPNVRIALTASLIITVIPAALCWILA